VLELNNFEIKNDDFNGGNFVRMAAGGSDEENSPMYLITNWEHFDELSVHSICSFT